MNPIAVRLKEERDKWRRDPPDGFSVNLYKNADGTLDLFKWECEMPGPRKTVWEQGRFKFTIQFHQKCLHYPPVINFNPVIFHPNVDAEGYICSDLRALWPEIGVKQIIFALQSFLEKPNPHSALNHHAAKLFLEDTEKYNNCVRSVFEVL